MKLNYKICFLLLPGLLLFFHLHGKPFRASKHSFSFLENKGQIIDQYSQPRPDIDFRISSNGVNTFIGKGTIHYQWAKPVNTDKLQTEASNKNVLHPITNEPQPWDMYRMDVTLVGTDKKAQLIKEKQVDYYEHYYLPQCGQEGATAYGYEKLIYKNVYPNIDWVLYVMDGHMKYDFVVHPGGKVSDIRMRYAGATALRWDETGGITAITPFGSVTEQAPVSFQEDGVPISSRYVLAGSTLSFAIGNYDARKKLIIDPTLIWGTYYGGMATGDDMTDDVEFDPVDADGVYICGRTTNITNIATTGSYQINFAGTMDAYLSKFNSAGVLQWGTYLGGTETDGQTSRITCDSLDNIYMVGITFSPSGIATPGSFQDTLCGPLPRPYKGSQDIFLVKFNSSGKRLWGTYYGGVDMELYPDVATDGLNVYLASATVSRSGIATIGSHQDINASRGRFTDAFLVKFDSSGKRQWATYYGGEINEGAGGRISVVADNQGFVYLAGTTSSYGMATPGSHQETIGDSLDRDDAFIVKFNSEGVRQWATYYGGESSDYGYSVICDDEDNTYLTGSTKSQSRVATGSSQQNILSGGRDIFIVKFDKDGFRQWGTYYGGAKNEEYPVICYNSGSVFLSAATLSTTGIATFGAYQSTNNATLPYWGTVFLAAFNSNSGIRNWATYYGGEGTEAPSGIAYDPHGYIYIGGVTHSASGIATPGSHNDTMIGFGLLSFLTKFCVTPNFSAYDVDIAGPDSLCANRSATYSIPAIEDATAYIWVLPSGWTGNSDNNSIDITCGTTGGLISVKFIRCDDTSDMKTYEVYVMPSFPPVITTDEFVLGTVDTTYSSYQWFLNDVAIPGATDKNYTVIANGDYKVVTTNSFGCSNTSEVYTITNYTGLEDINTLKQNIKIYPNPVSDRVYIQAPVPVSIILYSVEGRTLQNKSNVQSIDISHLAPGTYMLRILNREGILLKTEQLLKIAK